MGCKPSGYRHGSHFNPAGRVQGTTRTVTTENGAEIAGRKPLLLCRVRCGSGNTRRDFAYACKRWGIDAVCVQGWGEGLDAIAYYETTGSADGLLAFVEHGEKH